MTMIDAQRKLARFHSDKVADLEVEYQRRKQAGEKKIQAMQEELKKELTRIVVQITGHKKKARQILASIEPGSPSPPAKPQNGSSL